MDMEQLQLIVDLLAGAGEGTKDLVFLYFGYLMAKFLVYMTFYVVLVSVVYKLTMTLTRNFSFGGRVAAYYNLDLSYASSKTVDGTIERIRKDKDAGS